MVSFIVPVYNSEKYLRQCVESVLAQTFTDWELLLIDDGSTDSSGKICDVFARRSAKIKVFHTPNRGVSAARNKGIDNARGQQIAFLDADDILHPLFLELMMYFKEKNEADAVCCPFMKFSDESKLYSTREFSRKPFSKHDRTCKTMSGEQAAVAILHQRGMDSSAWGKIYDSHLWEGMRFREGIRYEDLDVVPLVMMRAILVARYPLKLYFYRQHPESYLATFSMGRADALDVTARLTERMRREAPRLLKAAEDREMSANFNMLGLAEQHKTIEGTREISDRCWRRIKELRGRVFRNPHIRIKNRIGIMASWFGRRFLALLFKL